VRSSEPSGSSEPPARARARFLPVPRSVPAARGFVLAHLDPPPGRGATWPAADPEAVALLTSELVSNAVRHARTPFTVTVEAAPDVVRVAVADDDQTRPRPAWPDPTAEHGRGLRLVGRLAHAWGVEEHGSSTRPGASPGQPVGKTVWFVLARPAPAPSAPGAPAPPGAGPGKDPAGH
jgi:signal transduction histidine kinase